MADQHVPPPMPPRPQEQQAGSQPQGVDQGGIPAYNPQDYASQQPNTANSFQAPPQRMSLEQEDIHSPIHFTRDPKKLIGYLVPFPPPKLHDVPADQVPQRYLIYTPPPPPISSTWKPKEGEKEGKFHKVQRKWEEELREAKTSNAKTTSWKGIKGKATKGIAWGMSQTKSSNLEFINRIGQNQEVDSHADDGHTEGEQTKKTVKLEEMNLIYPSELNRTPDQIREEFVNTMLRSKSKAQRDSIIATGLLPVGFAIDILATLVWPFGGLAEIDAVWLYSSIRGAKVSRSVTKRLSSTSQNDMDKDKLHLNFTPSPRLKVLEQYLAARCHEKDPKLFPTYSVSAPSETQVLENIGWSPSDKGGAERNWEDEQWEITEVKDDLKATMKKGANEWTKWVKMYEKEPEKAIKK